MTSTTTHLLPTHPPTTHPLGRGEGVIKLVEFFSSQRLTAYRTLAHAGQLENVLKGTSFKCIGRLRGTSKYFFFAQNIGFIKEGLSRRELWDGSLLGDFYVVDWYTPNGIISADESKERLIPMKDMEALTLKEFNDILLLMK